jgi:hypothetical protein
MVTKQKGEIFLLVLMLVTVTATFRFFGSFFVGAFLLSDRTCSRISCQGYALCATLRASSQTKYMSPKNPGIKLKR